MGRLLITGVPGWLADGLLRSLAGEAIEGIERIRCLVQPGGAAGRAELIERYGESVEFVEGDLCDKESLARAVKDSEIVLHGAGVLHVKKIRDFYAVNGEGTRNLVSAAKSAGVRRFVNVSSNAAAGRSESADRLMVEEDPCKPLSHYGKSKFEGEEAVMNDGGSMEVSVMRPCMFYGPPVPPRHVDIYRRIVSGRMPLVGSGNYARSLSYIDSLVQGTRLILEHEKAPGEVFYIADDEVYSTRRVVEAMAGALETEVNYLRLPEVTGPIAYVIDEVLSGMGIYWQNMHLVGESHWHVGVSCEKAMRMLGYRPTVRLEEGMRRAVRSVADEL